MKDREQQSLTTPTLNHNPSLTPITEALEDLDLNREKTAQLFTTQLLQNIKQLLQKRLTETDDYIKQNLHLDLTHKATVDEELRATVNKLKPNAKTLIEACGITPNTLGGTLTASQGVKTIKLSNSTLEAL